MLMLIMMPPGGDEVLVEDVKNVLADVPQLLFNLHAYKS